MSSGRAVRVQRPVPLSVSGRGAGRLRRLGLLLLLPVALSGCVSEQREQELGDVIATDINSRVPLVRDPILNAYVSLLGSQLVQVSGRPNLDYRFYIINSAMVNAFALPGGHIYLTRGLIARTQNPDELAAVLAHEVGHVAARHGIQKLQRHLRTGSLMSVLYHLILGGEPAILQQNALHMAGVIWSARHSRRDEMEADRLAVRYLHRAGGDPSAIISLLETLLQEEAQDTGGVANWFSTHPHTAERIRHTRSRVEEKEAEASPAREMEVASYDLFRRRLMRLPPPPDVDLY